MTAEEGYEPHPVFPWVSLGVADDQDAFRWWDCECSAYDGEATLDAALAAANTHGHDCRKGEARWDRANPPASARSSAGDQ